MLKRHTTFINSSFGLLIILFSAFTLHGATNSAVKGWVFDAQTGESLPGANISILNTSLGAATDLEGKYIISQIPPGLYTLRVTYIGYESFEDTVLVKENEIIKKHFQLRPAMLEGETIVVTAQAAGQMKAINQQLSSSSIVDIVSEDRIRELPDATAAESVGRLPGVSISRQGGEGTTVTIRGMSSKYNKINIEGIEMAATGSENRSVDISMISPYLLAGIEVKKTVTADHDVTSDLNSSLYPV